MQNTSFNHSVKVPKLYKCAAKISQKVAEGGGSIKQLVYEKTHFNTKALYALVATTFQKSKEIDLLLKRTKLFEKEPRLDPWLAKILISEVLWGKKQLPKSDAKPIQTILAYEQAFHAHLSDSSGDTTAAKPENPRKPRYVRVNTLINPFNQALELFQEEGWTLQTLNNKNDYESFLEQVSNLEGDFMLKDLHVPDLLIFPGGTEFYNHPGYKKGAIVLQDKASCLPVHLLSPPPGSVVLDMCAAPGMKTTQLATMLGNEGTVYAVERDQKRFEVLNRMISSSGATCVKAINKDVLDCNDSHFPGVEYILVDPSCSASGMTDRLELQHSRDPLRLQKLAGFQIKILRSALTRYPKAKKVVYSTCSLYPEENEDVVRQVLETNNQFKLVPAANFINNAWKNFGSPDFGDIGKYCLYARPEEDMTNGFFVAVLERLEEGENNQFFNGRVMNYRKNVEQKQARRERKYREKVEEGDHLDKREGKQERMSDIALNEVDVEVHGNDGGKNTRESLNENKQKDSEVNIPDEENTNINEFSKKQKKKRKHDEVESLMRIDEENKQLTNNDAAIKSDTTNEHFKKSKKNKPKDNEVENSKQTIENDIEPDVNATTVKPKSKSKKKKRKSMDVEKFEQVNNRKDKLINIIESTDRDAANENDELLKKGKKKKKNRHSDFVNLEQNHEETQKIFNDALSQGTERTNQTSKDERIGASLKKSKKKKRKDSAEADENNIELANNIMKEDFNQTQADENMNKTMSKSKKKKQKSMEVENYENTFKICQDAADLTEKILKNRKKKKNKHSDFMNLKETHETQEIVTEIPIQDIENTKQLLIDEELDKIFNEKEKKRKEGRIKKIKETYKGSNNELADNQFGEGFENINDLAGKILNESLNKTKKEKQKRTEGETEEYQQQTNEDSLVKSKKKKRKHSTVDDTTEKL